MKKMRQILFNLSIGGTGGMNTCAFCAPGYYSLVSYFYKIIALENLCFFNKDRLYIDGGKSALSVEILTVWFFTRKTVSAASEGMPPGRLVTEKLKKTYDRRAAKTAMRRGSIVSMRFLWFRCSHQSFMSVSSLKNKGCNPVPSKKQGRRTDSRLYGITCCTPVTNFLGGEDDHLKYYEYVS